MVNERKQKQPSRIPGAPLSVEWQIFVATTAIDVFQPFRDPRIGALIGRPNTPDGPDGKPVMQEWLTVGDFISYLMKLRPTTPGMGSISV